MLILTGVDTRFADPRPIKRSHSGIEAGAFAGGTVGLLLASMISGGAATLAGVVLAVVVGVAAGAVIGWALVEWVSVDEWDPGPTKRSHVGAQTPGAAADGGTG